MKQELNKRSILYFMSFMLMASTFLPIVFNNLPSIIRSHHIWTVLWFFSLITFERRVFNNKLFLFVLFYGAIMLLLLLNTLWASISDWDKNQLTWEYYEVVVAVSVITYFRVEKDFFRLAKLVKWTLLFIFITSIMTIVTAVLEPAYARSMTGLSAIQNQSELDYFLGFKKLGGGTYGFAAAVLCLFPLLVYTSKEEINNLTKKGYIIVFIVLMFLALISTQIFANIILAIFVIIFSFMGSKNINKIIFLASLFVIALLFIPIKTYSDLLISVSFIFPTDSEIYFKLNDLAKYLVLENYVGSAVNTRAERYPLLIESFIANPLLGHYFSGRTNDIGAGAHLHWMYKITVYGLLGSAPFFYIIYKFIRNSLKYFDKEFAFYFLLSLSAIIVLGLMKALTGRELWYMFFVIVPGYYYLRLLKKTKGIEENNNDNNSTKTSI